MGFWQREKVRLAEMLLGPKRPRRKGMVETMLGQRAAGIRASDDSAPAAQDQRSGGAKPNRPAASQPVRVVINPGHAPGAGGAPGAHINEADATGGIAGLMPARSGRNVTYEEQRQQGSDLGGLQRRLQANPPQILASVHMNAPSTTSRTVTVIYRGEDRDPVRREASRRLAESVGRALAELPEYDGYTVVATPRADLPNPRLGILDNTATDAAIVVEAGFITNPQTEAFVQTPGGQGRIADAIDQGIRNYLNSPRAASRPAPAQGRPAPAGRGTPPAPGRPAPARPSSAPARRTPAPPRAPGAPTPPQLPRDRPSRRGR